MLTNRFTLLVILAVISCDSLQEKDEIIPEKQVTLTLPDYYILPGSATIIDLESVIKESFSNATLRVSEYPRRGTLSELSTFLLKYRPSREFQEGADHLVLSVESDGKMLTKKTMTIKMKKNKEDFPCGSVAVEDKIRLKTGSSLVSTRILENDWLCGIDRSSLSISIFTQPKFGQAIVENESIIYIPATEYKGHDELIYGVAGSTDESTIYGLVSFAGRAEITIQKMTGKEFRAIAFPDENTGFLATDAGLYKTTDGGTNWNVMVSEGLYQDIFFVDAENGFVVNEVGGLITTKDGGSTWTKPIYFNEFITSVAFTSETTGFITVSDLSDYEDYTTTEVLKTEDGGETWKKVLADTSPGWGYGDIQFINPTTGYAILSERIFVTDDAGETWNVLPSRVNHFLAIEESKFFGVLDGPIIFTSQDAIVWRPVAYLSSISTIGFSPSAEVGFASVQDMAAPRDKYGSPNPQAISIVKTVDKGETWVEENMDEVLFGVPFAMSIPSNEVSYFLCYDRIIKYSNK